MSELVEKLEKAAAFGVVSADMRALLREAAAALSRAEAAPAAAKFALDYADEELEHLHRALREDDWTDMAETVDAVRKKLAIVCNGLSRAQRDDFTSEREK